MPTLHEGPMCAMMFPVGAVAPFKVRYHFGSKAFTAYLGAAPWV